ncbi:Flavin-dependent halogenase armH4 [Stygiomarasmius scandens]|uniref:Flavin-dependent halogenase armH4 n=1 Tax=Marasmiellus scandens TaxID=2682957 RepID=A0ABR1JNL0_9AGAR
MSTPPAKTQILVIGGGPAGSYSASALAREGFDVVVLEAVKHPRYHIGESMLPSVRPFLRFIDAEKKIVDHGFEIKRGAAVKFNQWKREAYTDFVAISPENGSWNVIRSEFDEILLRHAQQSGAKVFEGYKVNELQFAPDSEHRPVSATFTGPDGQKASISFEYLVDASGRLGIMSTKYLKNRLMNNSLKNLACWGYWKGAGVYMPGSSRHNAPWFESLTDESGWAWFIPLHNGTVSVGIVEDSTVSATKKAAQKGTLRDHYLAQFELVPGLKQLLGDATLVEDGPNTVKSATDFSYAATAYAGDHFRLVGDASAFIDPFFSSGVHLALAGGLTAATSIAGSIRGHCTEKEAATFHDKKVGVSYTRFLLVVMGAYKQIRAQEVPVLSDVDEDNFDRAFDLIRPVIQGTADAGKKITEDEVQKTMDFVKNVFAPTDPEMHEAVGARLDSSLFSADAPLMTSEDIDKLVGKDEDAKAVLGEINARKPIHAMYAGPAHLAMENVNGLIGNMVTGSLGLKRAEA